MRTLVINERTCSATGIPSRKCGCGCRQEASAGDFAALANRPDVAANAAAFGLTENESRDAFDLEGEMERLGLGPIKSKDFRSPPAEPAPFLPMRVHNSLTVNEQEAVLELEGERERFVKVLNERDAAKR